jgi:hypothetical protein
MQAAFNFHLKALHARAGMHLDAVNQPPQGLDHFGPFGGFVVLQRGPHQLHVS